MAQSVARQAVNLQVAGSNPAVRNDNIALNYGISVREHPHLFANVKPCNAVFPLRPAPLELRGMVGRPLSVCAA